MKRGSVALSALCLALVACTGARAGGSSLTLTPVDSAERLPATLLKPEGPGPFPAVVIMHDCSGLGTPSSGAPGRWASFLVAQGYVVLLPDSFTPRGFGGGVCTVPGQRTRLVNGFARAADAYGALAYLRTLPFVDRARIGLMGGSHGGWTTLAAMSDDGTPGPLGSAKRDGFVAAIALYPACGHPYGSWSVSRQGRGPGPITGYSGVYKPLAPLLILIGERDDWTPAEACRRLVEAGRAAGHPLDIKVYPGAYHAFDSYAPPRYVAERTNGNSPTGHGATTGGDLGAWNDAKQQVTAFFARYLKRP